MVSCTNSEKNKPLFQVDLEHVEAPKHLNRSPNAKKIVLRDIEDSVVVIYKSYFVDFSFGRNDLLEYCKKDETMGVNQLAHYIRISSTNPIIIPDSLGQMRAKDSKDSWAREMDGMAWIRDQKSSYSFTVDAMGWAVLDLLSSGAGKVYDRQTGEYVDYIFIDIVDDYNSGHTLIYLPNDSLAFGQMRWIK